LLSAEGVECPVLHLGLPDAYLDHASREDLLAQAGLDVAGVRASVLKRWPELGLGTPARAAS
jgi:1-deoxy-D-xylulose-5-phosphate synthase